MAFTEFHQTCLENTGQAFGATLMLVKLRMTLPGNFWAGPQKVRAPPWMPLKDDVRAKISQGPS